MIKRRILIPNGVISDTEMQKNPSVLACPRCTLVNGFDN